MFEDDRGGPAQPLNCAGCGVSVLVKKNSLAHTVVQWTTSTDACRELGSAADRAAATCSLLRDSIDAAVRTRRLEVAELSSPGPEDSRSPGASPPPVRNGHSV